LPSFEGPTTPRIENVEVLRDGHRGDADRAATASAEINPGKVLLISVGVVCALLVLLLITEGT
jgi:hypothetical protein